MIEVTNLAKRYGSTVAVDDLTFTVHPGRVTGFLGPNGAGKTTTMRLILGLDAPSRGSVAVDGRSYRELPAPMREVGALLDAKAVHGGRSARAHLLCLAQSNGIPASRVDEVLILVGLDGVAKRRAKGYSLGMGQRLGIAAALLGDPGILIFDEPVNGLDPEGIVWVRNLMRALAAEGRTVLVSSHLMSEMALTADHLVVIGKGKLIANTSVDDFIRSSSQQLVHVRSPQVAELSARLRDAGASVRVGSSLKSEGMTGSAGNRVLPAPPRASLEPSQGLHETSAPTVVDHQVRDTGPQLGVPRSASESAPGAGPAAAPAASADPDVIEVTGMESSDIGRLAAAHGLVLFELTPIRASLEEAFMDLTRESVEFQASEVAK